MGKKSKKPSLHSLSRLPVDAKTFMKELRGESDRASALIAGAVISEKLGDLLHLYFGNLPEGDVNRLFHDRGAPLGDFASRTDVSFALGLISPQERLACNTIRNIRNVFAHTSAQIDFSNILIAAELSKLTPDEPAIKDTIVKAVFVELSTLFYMTLLYRSRYLADKRVSELTELGASALIPIYKLAMKVQPRWSILAAPQ